MIYWIVELTSLTRASLKVQCDLGTNVAHSSEK
jgi:hypothetical protein